MKGNNAAGHFANLYITQGFLSTLTFAVFKAQLDKAFCPVALQYIAEVKLLKLCQGKETVEDFIIQMKQLVLEANYNITTHSYLLINILCNGIHNDIVECIELSCPDLLDSHFFTAWEAALVYAKQILSNIADRKQSCNLGIGPTLFSLCNAPTKFAAMPIPS